jgi:hypothetical protein
MTKHTSCEVINNFLTFFENRRFIIVFTRAIHRSVSSIRLIQSIPPHPIPLNSILIASSNRSMDLSNVLFPSHVPCPKLSMLFLSHHKCYMPCPFRLFRLTHSNYAWRRVEIMKLLIRDIFPNLVIFHTSSIQKFPAAPYSQITLVYVLPLRLETKFNTRTKYQLRVIVLLMLM